MHRRCQLQLLWLGPLLLAAGALARAEDREPPQVAGTGTTKSAQRRLPVDIRDPEPDSANFPNSAFTLRKGHLYIENSPLGFSFGAETVRNEYQWAFLIRYGLTDRIEFRVFSNGLTARGKPDPTTGFSPLAFDVKAHFWDERRKYFIPAVATEIYIQTAAGSQAFDSGTFPSVNLLFDHTLPGEIAFEYNIGTTREQSESGQTFYVLSFPWAFMREIVEDFNVFAQGFYGATALPRLQDVRAGPRRPSINAVGAGAVWTVNSRSAIWGSYSFGTTQHSSNMVALGFAIAF
jgi:hypothetical protein